MTDAPEPDTQEEHRSPASSVTAADTLARKLIDRAENLVHIMDGLSGSAEDIEVQAYNLAYEFCNVWLPALVEAASFYQGCRKEEMQDMPFEPFGILTALQMVRHEAMTPAEYLNAEEENEYRQPTDDPIRANLISSRIIGPLAMGRVRHKPLIDIDLACELRPSKTPGHYHLIIDKAVDDDKYWVMLDAMVYAGVVEEGFVRLAKERGATHIRAFPTMTGWLNEEAKNNQRKVPMAPTGDLCNCDHERTFHTEPDVVPCGCMYPGCGCKGFSDVTAF